MSDDVPRLSASETVAVAGISAALRTVRLGEPSAISTVLPQIREFLDVECTLLFSPSERLSGWGLERLELDNFPNRSRFASTFASFLARAPYRFWFFDPVHPEAQQRDRVLDGAGIAPEATYRESPICREVLSPMGLDRHRHLRALVCEGPALLAWVGGFTDGPIERAHHRRLAALLPALRQRLAIERLVRRPLLIGAALDLILDQIGAPAFLLTGRSALVLVNSAGRALLDRDRKATVDELERVMSGGVDTDSFEVIPLVVRGAPKSTLVVLRVHTRTAQIDQRVGLAASRWALTPRQREVLGFVVRGVSNAAIAETLEICERSVEMHVSALFDRLQLDNRAALVSRVLLLS